MCLSDLSSVKNSVIPVLTKCKPDDDEFDLDEFRNMVSNILDEEFKTLTEYCKDNKTRDVII